MKATVTPLYKDGKPIPHIQGRKDTTWKGELDMHQGVHPILQRMVSEMILVDAIGNVIDPFELVEKFGVDAVRYFLLREISSGEDGDFTLEKFKERYNGDLANGLGNFAARVSTVTHNLLDYQEIGFNKKNIEFSYNGDKLAISYSYLDNFLLLGYQ